MIRIIKIKRLKWFALNHLPERESIARELILSEEDAIPVMEFVGKIGPWLRAMEIDLRKKLEEAESDV